MKHVPSFQGVCRVIQDLMRGNSPSKTSTLQDLDRYVKEPRYKGMKAPVSSSQAQPCADPENWARSDHSHIMWTAM